MSKRIRSANGTISARVDVTLSADQYDKLYALSREKGISMASLIRLTIPSLIARYSGKDAEPIDML